MVIHLRHLFSAIDSITAFGGFNFTLKEGETHAKETEETLLLSWLPTTYRR